FVTPTVLQTPHTFGVLVFGTVVLIDVDVASVYLFGLYRDGTARLVVIIRPRVVAAAVRLAMRCHDTPFAAVIKVVIAVARLATSATRPRSRFSAIRTVLLSVEESVSSALL